MISIQKSFECFNLNGEKLNQPLKSPNHSLGIYLKFSTLYTPPVLVVTTKMTELSEFCQAKYTETISELNDEQIRYVVLRGYEGYPTTVRYGGDVDMYIHEDDFEQAISTIFEPRFEHAHRSIAERGQNFVSIIKHVRNPFSAGYKLIFDTSTREFVKRRLRRNKKQTTTQAIPEHQFAEVMFEEGNLEFNIQNHIAFRSYGSPYPAEGDKSKKRRVHPEIERKFLEHRRLYNDQLFIPDVPENLLQLLLRIVLEYPQQSSSEVPEYYQTKCNELIEQLQTQPDINSRFRDLLSLVFFNAEETVYSLIMDHKYDQIRDQLTKFDRY